jgi:hypothetical protein
MRLRQAKGLRIPNATTAFGVMGHSGVIRLILGDFREAPATPE